MKHNEAISDDSSEWHDYRELLSQGEYEKGHDKTIPGEFIQDFLKILNHSVQNFKKILNNCSLNLKMNINQSLVSTDDFCLFYYVYTDDQYKVFWRFRSIYWTLQTGIFLWKKVYINLFMIH